MRKLMSLVARALAGLVGLAGAATVVARVVSERRRAGEIDALLADSQLAPSAAVSEGDLERLPEPVRRWLRYAQVVGSQRPTTVRLRQEGDFQLEGRGWLPYRAEQYFTTDPPGFCGRRGSGSPLVSVVGRNQYRGGQASMQMRVLSLVPVANKAGGGLNQGDLLRYLGSDFKATLVGLLANKYGLELMHFAMERKMLLGVKRRAEQAAARCAPVG